MDTADDKDFNLEEIRGKVLEKVLINRINHHIYSHDLVNTNHYGFTPQRNTIDAAMAVKDFVEEGLVAGELIVSISLDVKGAFAAAWWPSILNGLKACGCHKNLYKVINSYFSQRTGILLPNKIEWREK